MTTKTIAELVETNLQISRIIDLAIQNQDKEAYDKWSKIEDAINTILEANDKDII